jgi:hypothetical protein
MTEASGTDPAVAIDEPLDDIFALTDQHPRRGIGQTCYVLAGLSLPTIAFLGVGPDPLLGIMGLLAPVFFMLTGLSIGGAARPRWAVRGAVVVYVIPVVWGVIAAIWDAGISLSWTSGLDVGSNAGYTPSFAFGGYFTYVFLWPLQVLWIFGVFLAGIAGYANWTV